MSIGEKLEIAQLLKKIDAITAELALTNKEVIALMMEKNELIERLRLLEKEAARMFSNVTADTWPESSYPISSKLPKL